MIGRELCPGLFFSDREEKDPRSSAGGAREAEPVRIHGEPVRLSETPHGQDQDGEPVRVSKSDPEHGAGKGRAPGRRPSRQLSNVGPRTGRPARRRPRPRSWTSPLIVVWSLVSADCRIDGRRRKQALKGPGRRHRQTDGREGKGSQRAKGSARRGVSKGRGESRSTKGNRPGEGRRAPPGSVEK